MSNLVLESLLKPLEEKQVFECIDRLLNELKFAPKTFCKIKTNDLTITSINIKDIAYIESINRRIQFYMKNGDVVTSTTLHSKFLDSIPFEYQKYSFINCHASYVINMNYIKGITDIKHKDNKYVFKINTEVLPLPRFVNEVGKFDIIDLDVENQNIDES